MTGGGTKCREVRVFQTISFEFTTVIICLVFTPMVILGEASTWDSAPSWWLIVLPQSNGLPGYLIQLGVVCMGMLGLTS